MLDPKEFTVPSPDFSRNTPRRSNAGPSHGVALVFASGLAALALYAAAHTFDWPAWLPWLGPVGVLLWEVRQARLEAQLVYVPAVDAKPTTARWSSDTIKNRAAEAEARAGGSVITEYGVRLADGPVMQRTTRDAAVSTLEGTRARGIPGTLVTRQTFHTPWVDELDATDEEADR